MKRILLSLLFLSPATNIFANQQEKKGNSPDPNRMIAVCALAFSAYAACNAFKAYEGYQSSIFHNPELQTKIQRQFIRLILSVESIYDFAMNDNQYLQSKTFLKEVDWSYRLPIVNWSCASFISGVFGLIYLMTAEKK